MFNTRGWIALGLLSVFAVPAMAQSFRVQCPTSTVTHPNPASNNSEPTYVGPTYTGTTGYGTTPAHVNGAIKCQQISGGDGYATMGDGTQTYLFSFGPLSGLASIASGQPGTLPPSAFNTRYDPTTTKGPLQPGDPAATVAPVTTQFVPPLTPAQMTQLAGFYNGAVGLDYNVVNSVNVLNISETGTTVTVVEVTREREYDRYYQEVQRRIHRVLVFPKILLLHLEQGETVLSFSVRPGIASALRLMRPPTRNLSAFAPDCSNSFASCSTSCSGVVSRRPLAT